MQALNPLSKKSMVQGKLYRTKEMIKELNVEKIRNRIREKFSDAKNNYSI